MSTKLTAFAVDFSSSNRSTAENLLILQNSPKVNAPFIIIIGFISGTKPIAIM